MNKNKSLKIYRFLNRPIIFRKVGDSIDLLISGIFTHISLPDNTYRRPFIQGFWDGNDWVLDNGNPLVYTNWASGQPEIVNNKRYLKFSNGEWKTSMASNIRPVFCSYIQ